MKLSLHAVMSFKTYYIHKLFIYLSYFLFSLRCLSGISLSQTYSYEFHLKRTREKKKILIVYLRYVDPITINSFCPQESYWTTLLLINLIYYHLYVYTHQIHIKKKLLFFAVLIRIEKAYIYHS